MQHSSSTPHAWRHSIVPSTQAETFERIHIKPSPCALTWGQPYLATHPTYKAKFTLEGLQAAQQPSSSAGNSLSLLWQRRRVPCCRWQSDPCQMFS